MTTWKVWHLSAGLRIERHPAAVAYMIALRDSTFVRDLIEGRLALEWAATRMISDDPAKGLGLAPPEALLPYKLREILGDPAVALDLVAPYFGARRRGGRRSPLWLIEALKSEF